MHISSPGSRWISSLGRARILATAIPLIYAVMTTQLSAAAADQSAAPPPPVVIFQLEAAPGEPALRACQQAWNSYGAALTAALLPAGTRPDSVGCLILTTAGFGRLFGGRLPDWGVGVAVPSGRLIALDYERLPAIGRTAREVFLHEMTHALLFQGSRGVWLPTWLHEGIAMQLSGEWRFVDTVSVALSGRLPDLYHLRGPFPGSAAPADRAYRTSLLAVGYLQSQYGEDIVIRLVSAVTVTGDFAAAFTEVTGDDIALFEARFAGAMKLKYGWLVMIFRWPTLFVLMALVLAIGAIAKIVRTRRRMAEMEE
jgi:hypothetical protein